MAKTIFDDVSSRTIAITKVIGIAMAVAHDHPEECDTWIAAGIGALLELGVTDAEMAAAVRHAPFIDLDEAKNAAIDKILSGSKS